MQTTSEEEEEEEEENNNNNNNNNIGEGAQSTLDERHFFPKNMYDKLTNFPNFTWFLSEILSKYPNFNDILPKNYQNCLILHDFLP